MRDRNPHSRARSAAAYVLLALLCLTPLTASGQKKSWQAGTFLNVKPHPGESKSENKGKQYDISVKVGKKVYVVLYVVGPDQPEPANYIGMARTVLIDGNILKFNDLEGRVHSTTILSSRDASSK